MDIFKLRDKGFKPLEVVNAIIEAGKETDTEFTPLQIVKLAYITHGWWLEQTDKPLVCDKAEAWKYGPVFPKIYNAVRRYGRNKIPMATKFDTSIGMGASLTDPAKDFIKETVKAYKDFTGIQLSSLTHQPNTPWEKTYVSGSGSYRNNIIPNDLIKKHYIGLRKNGE